MKKNLLIAVILTLFFTGQIYAQSKNKITIENTNLRGGGTEYVIKGGPDVITHSPFGTIYSDQSQLVILKNKEKLINYTGLVNFNMQKLQLTIESDEMTDKGNGLFTFQSGIIISKYGSNKAIGTTTFECKDGKVVKNGQPTGQSSVTFHEVLTISCNSNNILTVTPKQF